MAALLVAGGVATAMAESLRFETISSEKGLSENAVKAIVEDRQGFLWFGTEHGLNRFDGLEFQTFSTGSDAVHELVEDHINALYVDRDGKLWVGTFGGGLSCYDPTTGAFRNFLHDRKSPHSLSSNDVSAIWQDGSGLMWIGTHGGGLNRLDPKSGDVASVALPGTGANPAAAQISAIVGDGAGGFWLGTLGAGLFHFDADRRASGAEQGGINATIGNDITALLLDSRLSLWVGTQRHGLARRLADGRFQSFRHDAAVASSLAHDTVNRLYEDRRQRVWVGTAQGLDQFDALSEGFGHNRHDPSDASTLPYNDIFAVFQDSLGTLWVGTGGGGAARHTQPGRQFTLIEHDPDDPRGASSGGVWSVLEDEKGGLWVGTLDGGLQALARGADHFTSYRQQSDASNPLTDNDVRALVEDGPDRLWVGTRHGLNLLERSSGKVRRYLHDPQHPGSLGLDYIRPLLRDAQGTIWIGTYGGGLDRYLPEHDEFAHYRHDPARSDSLSDDRVYSLLSDREGALWIGTHGGGLNRMDRASGRFSRFQHDPRDASSLSNDRVLALQQDRRGTLWVGTGSGLDRFDPPTGRFAHQKGLQHDLIYGIAEDDLGQLWISTSDGIVRLDPGTGRLRRFPMRELWGNSEFNGGAWCRGRSGRIYFGGVSGVVEVQPNSVPDQRDAATPVLTDFRLFNRSVRTVVLDADSPLRRPVEFVDRIVLTYQDSVFGFAFAALRAAHPERRQFSYRLEGFDDRWLETHAGKRDATYTGVPAGDYTFRLRTTDADGAWLPNEASVRITVLPAPWRSDAAYAGYAAAITSLITYWAWRRSRRRAIKRQAQLALKRSEERLSLALWGSGDELLDWNLETGMMLRLVGKHELETRASEGLSGIDALAPLIHQEDFPAVRDALIAHFTGSSSHLEVTYRERTPTHDWPWKLVRAKVVARDPTGRPLRLSGMQQDITRIKAVEAELRELNLALDERVRERTRELEGRQSEIEARQRDLEGANNRLSVMLDELRRTQTELVEAEKMASLGRLVAGVAHEVNTPLGVSVTAVSFLRSQIGSIRTALQRHLGDAEAARILAPMEQAGDMTETNLKRAANLVKTFKQVAVDQVNPEFRKILVCEYIENTLQSLNPRLRMVGHRVEINGDPTLAMTGRPDALYQIIVNLVMNSIMHAFPDGVVGRIAIGVEHEGNQLRLSYVDDGLGMSAEVASRIFEPFFTTRRETGGTGLGMHIVYNLVTQALAGRISVVTAPGQGVRFEIVFPQVHPRSA